MSEAPREILVTDKPPFVRPAGKTSQILVGDSVVHIDAKPLGGVRYIRADVADVWLTALENIASRMTADELRQIDEDLPEPDNAFDQVVLEAREALKDE